MIKYALRCNYEHEWDAWFPSISGFDDQQKRGLVECPFCQSKSVQKAIMAPSVVTSRARSAPDETPKPVSDDANLPVATPSLDLQVPEPLKALIAELKERVEKTHDYVGDTFAREVRAMHEGETQERPIYGKATATEIKALIEDEIQIAPLPFMADPKGTTH